MNQSAIAQRRLSVAAAILGVALLATSPALAQAPNFDASRLTPGVETFTFLLQGAPIGTMTITTTIENGVVHSTNEVHIAVQGMSQTMLGEVRFSAEDLSMISNEQHMDFGMMQAETMVNYDRGHVTGTGQNPSQTGIATTEIDTVIGDDVIDSSAMFSLLSTLDWAEGKSYQFDTFRATSGSISTTTATATADEVTVPEGSFTTWRVAITGSPQRNDIWIDQESGRVVKIVPAGQPVEIVLGTVAPSGSEN